jgi:hypothetical protein
MKFQLNPLNISGKLKIEEKIERFISPNVGILGLFMQPY